MRYLPQSEYPSAKVVLIECDLMSFDSVRKAAQEVKSKYPNGIDVLSCNAGVMALKDEATVDG